MIETARRGRHAADPDTATVAPLLVRHLTKRFGDIAVVSDLNFDVPPGQVTGFVGANGAGKTTTMRMIMGLTTPTAGEATFGGVAYRDLSHPQRKVGAVIEANFHPGRTGRDHLRVSAVTAGADHARVDGLLEQVGLSAAARRRVGTYSLGMRQRLALADALLGDPDYLLLDEPANGLDPEGVRWLRGFLRSFARSGRSVLVSTHLLGELQATADRVVIIDGGRLLRKGALADLLPTTGACRLRVADPRHAQEALRSLGLGAEIGADDRGPHLTVTGADAPLVGDSLFRAGIPVHELTPFGLDLEQQFFAMVEESR